MTPKEQSLFCINHGIHVIAGYPVGKSERMIIKVPAEVFDKPIVNELADGIEVKTHFTPIYPSKRTDGLYQPFNETDTLAEVAECPDWLIKLIHEPRKTSRAPYNNNKGGAINRTYGADIWELFNNGATDGSRNNDTNRVLHYWRKIGIEPSTCMDLLQTFNSRTSPPLDDDELATIWKSVFKMN